MADIFGAVDLTSVSAFIVASGVIIMAIALSFKGITLGKRAVAKV